MAWTSAAASLRGLEKVSTGSDAFFLPALSRVIFALFSRSCGVSRASGLLGSGDGPEYGPMLWRVARDFSTTSWNLSTVDCRVPPEGIIGTRRGSEDFGYCAKIKLDCRPSYES